MIKTVDEIVILVDWSWYRRWIIKAFPCKLILRSESTLCYMHQWKFFGFSDSLTSKAGSLSENLICTSTEAEQLPLFFLA